MHTYYDTKIDVNIDDIKYYQQKIIKTETDVNLIKIDKLYIIGNIENIWAMYLINFPSQYKYNLFINNQILATSTLCTEINSKYYNKQYFTFYPTNSDLTKIFLIMQNNKYLLDVSKAQNLYIDVINDDQYNNYHIYDSINKKFLYDEYSLDILDSNNMIRQIILKPNNTFKNTSPKDFYKIIDGFIEELYFNDSVVIIINNKFVTLPKKNINFNESCYKSLVDFYSKESKEYHYIIEKYDKENEGKQLVNFNNMNNVYFVTNNITDNLQCKIVSHCIYYDAYDNNDKKIISQFQNAIKFGWNLSEINNINF